MTKLFNYRIQLISRSILLISLLTTPLFVNATDFISGNYVGKGNGSINTLYLKKTNNSKLDFSASTTSTWRNLVGDKCTGNIDGTAKIHGEEAIFYDPEADCKISIKLHGDNVIVSEQKFCMYYHGAQCSFDATYHRKTSKKH